jgi:manganese transport protein
MSPRSLMQSITITSTLRLAPSTPVSTRRKTHPILDPQPAKNSAGHTLITTAPLIARQSHLYLHTAIVQTRAYGGTLGEKRQALKFATIDSTVALMFALLINASILILAASAFHGTGRTEIAEIGEAHVLLAPLLGSAFAPTLFGIALLCCGLNSTVTATLAGQAVIEGFLEIRLPPWVRRLVTRLVAIVPAAAVTIWYGDSGTAQFLILSQVVLSLQLSFAVIPLVMFTSSRAKMGALVAPRWLVIFASLIAAVIVASTSS